MAEGDTLLNAIVGAVATVVLAFTGFSPLLGGGVAGYLQGGTRRAGAKVGALSGLLAFLPFFLLGFLFFGFFAFVPLMGGGMGMPGGVELLVILFVMVPLFIAWNVGLGAVGGYLGTYLREELAD
ncbi:MAG: DUF5518 domain-containing protein [Halobacteriales archaeon]